MKCDKCNGTKFIELPKEEQIALKWGIVSYEKCPVCNGTGIKAGA